MIHIYHTAGLIFIYNKFSLRVGETLVHKSIFEMFAREYSIQIKIFTEIMLFLLKNSLNINVNYRDIHLTLEVPACTTRMK